MNSATNYGVRSDDPTDKTGIGELEVSIIQFRFNLERVFPKGFISFVLFGFECFWADSLGQTGLNETRQHFRRYWQISLGAPVGANIF